jgi:hypothetical protein
VALLELVALTWFMVGLCLLLRCAEGEPSLRSTVALVFGALFAAYLFTDTSWDGAGNRTPGYCPTHSFGSGSSWCPSDSLEASMTILG